MPFGAGNTYIAYMREYPLSPPADFSYFLVLKHFFLALFFSLCL